MKQFLTIDDIDMTNKRVLLRLDLNVPMQDGEVTDATRLVRALPTLEDLQRKKAKIIILAHFGRPDGEHKMEYSLAPIVKALGEVVGEEIAFAEDCIGETAEKAIAALAPGKILVLENVRFYKGEEKNDSGFVKELAKLGDIYVNDAFSAAHRAHASTEGLAHVLPAVAGRGMEEELKALSTALDEPKRPVVAIVGGSKVSTKLDVLNNLVEKVNTLVIGGGMANTFLHAFGIGVGKSLCEKELKETALRIFDKAKQHRCDVIIPVDAVVAKEFKAGAATRVVTLSQIEPSDMILDIGPETVAQIAAVLTRSKTVVWNGPVGAFETPPFDQATKSIAEKIAKLTENKKLVSVAGGGDTVAAVVQAGVADSMTYISTAGGAFLEWMEGKELPGVTALKKAAARKAA